MQVNAMLFNCACTVCGKNMRGSQPAEVAEHAKYKCGELSYVELAHIECARQDRRMAPGYWVY